MDSDGIQAIRILGSRLALAGSTSLDKKPSKPVPNAIPDKKISNPISNGVHDEKPSQAALKSVHLELRGGLSLAKELLDSIEVALQLYGQLVERSGNAFRETFAQIYKDQKDQLRQYTDFREQYADQFGSIVNVLEGHRKDIADSSRAATEQNASLCNIIGQYRQTVEDNQRAFEEHVNYVNKTIEGHDTLIAKTRHLAGERDDYVQNELNKHTKLIEGNDKLIREQGLSIDKLVSDHADLVAEYQKALDGLALLITANRIFTLIHETPRWKSFGDRTRQFVAEETQQPTEEHAKRISDPKLGTPSANVVDNVQQIARTFRDDMINAMNAKPDGMSHRDWLATRRISSIKVDDHDWNLDTISGMDQLMATVFGQLKDTLQSAVEARYAEEMKELRQGQEDMEKLRADLGDIQEVRRLLRRLHELEDRMQQHRETEALREKEAQQARREEEVRRLVREEMDRRAAEGDTIASATSDVTASRDGDTLTAATITNLTDLTYPEPIPTGAPAVTGDTGAPESPGHEADDVADDATDKDDDVSGEGRLLGDFLGRMLAREDWPDKKKPRRMTRKMHAMARQRAEQQKEE
ncbi:hypothetical protein INS49_004973 [Diaporthe citri]|uniref:uncharacterized protein n=1 Tax=Diaporthe citri TaxID=83186 RepID=UPI001C806827|nr:uncharacterized protein INS49_004973 [Diaporthe citri]KAG6354002.1 hypothetical protein INS49_004973 [Diaporthe citri]